MRALPLANLAVLAALCFSSPARSAPAHASSKAPAASTGAPASTAAPAPGAARPASAPAASRPIEGPCRDLLSALPSGKLEPAPYLAAAACLRLQDSLAARPGDKGPHSPLERMIRSASGRSPSASDSILKARLPDDKNWLMTCMERMRVRRDVAGIQDMAYLAEAKGTADPDLYRELSALYLTIPDTYRAGLALLRQAEVDSLQGGYIQYQLESLTHYAGSDVPAEELLDSLTSGYVHRNIRTAEMLESLCWSSRAYPAAYRNLLAMMDLKNPGPSLVLERVNRFQSLGYFDYAAAILDKLAWRKLSQPWLTLARTLHLQIRNQLQDWPAITAEAQASTVTGQVRPPQLSDEETFIVANAFLKLGRPEETLARVKGLEDKGEAPWGFRGRLLKAQAQMALGRSKEAGQTLDALKRDPKRREATGPILFWQACLALDQGRDVSADSLLVLASAYTGAEESQRALEYRFFLLVDTGKARAPFFKGLPESPHSPAERRISLDRVDAQSGLWPFAQLEKAQILLQNGEPDSAEAVFDLVSKRSPDRLAGFQAEAKAAFTAEKLPGGRQAALARYEDLLIKYQQGVIPEFSRGRIKALR
ncbi:MAG: hypothetical protein JWO30_3591 [Fibrobacteres bacterium]|nr:hypothetical protein [Fibrobacterota bacterium]